MIRDQALVLRRSAYGESSLIVQVMTRDRGRVHLIAKGAFRRTSGYAWVLDWFDTLDLTWSPSRDGAGLATLSKGAVAVRRKGPRRDLAAYRAALELLELCELASRDDLPDPRLFQAAQAGLDALEGVADASPDAGVLSARRALAVFQFELMSLLGLAPALNHCASCGGEAETLPAAERDGSDQPARVAFSAGAGGRLCLACAREARASGRRVGTLPAQLLADAADLARCGEHHGARESDVSASGGAGTLTPVRLTAVARFVERFMDYHLELRPRSRRAAPTEVMP